MDMNHRAGTIFPEYWICCAKCCIERGTGETDKLDVHKGMRKLGWKQTRFGWVCPKCKDLI